MRKRAKIRLLQQRRQNEVSNFKDLPDKIQKINDIEASSNLKLVNSKTL